MTTDDAAITPARGRWPRRGHHDASHSGCPDRRRRQAWRAAAVGSICLLALAAGGCSGETGPGTPLPGDPAPAPGRPGEPGLSDPRQGPPGSADPDAVAPAPPRVGDPAPPLDLSWLGDGPPPLPSLRWDDLRGQVVILDFWATWCAPCIASVPHLNNLVEATRGRPVQIISVAYEPPAAVAAFLDQHPLRTLRAVDNNLATFRAYGAWSLPTTVLVNGEGRIAGVVHPESVTLEVIETLLAGRTPALDQAEPVPDPEGSEALFRRLLRTEETVW